MLLLAFVFASTDGLTSRADVILDWNATLREAIQTGRYKPDPGWSTRAMGMMNGAMYDSLMAIERTHQPFLVDTTAAADTSRDAALTQAAFEILANTYPEQASMFDAARSAAMNGIPDGPTKAAGIALGQHVANQYIQWRADDGSLDMVPYMPGTDPGEWQPDPLNPGQEAWGPGWGVVKPFAMLENSQFVVPPPPSMDSVEYAEAFNEVKLLGAKDSAMRTDEQTEIAIFWGYDRPGMGPPPVIYNQSAAEIAMQHGNTMEENARMFAMSMIAQADAGIAAWDAKFRDNLWRPITGIREADTDGNPLTEADPDWEPFGAPGGGEVPNFTPPFPAYVSGHATFGEAVFRSIAAFYGTDDVGFTLWSGETPGVIRSFDSLSAASEENARSRIYLGIHWNFDDVEGRALGRQISDWVTSNYFTPVPEPSTVLLAIMGLGGVVALIWRRERADASDSTQRHRN